ncbi:MULTISPECIES: DUF6338 family protein [Actinomadura]|uniref:Uncharacterized protein n=1 Tax=Actinomadura madurae TaxID=1993 RepID=A0A1I5CUP7_9ACTN|nr:DUF6338 family protein [Actinomadura madurae]SFN90684.1 hypothetical protein SAMN04489713_103387 [Actinomadura madurae]
MTEASIVVPVALLALAAVPGMHFDLMRGRRERPRLAAVPPRCPRVLIAGTLITTVTLTVLEALGQGSLLGLGDLLGGRAAPGISPPEAIWSVCCYLAFSLTLSSLAAAVLARLENRPGPFPAAVRPGTRLRTDYSEREVELEITLNSGATFRGLLGDESAGRGPEVPFITLCGPIFQLDGHGKPLPLDALHWERMVVPTRAVTSVLVRPVEEQPPPTVFRGVPSRHSAPRLRLRDQLRTLVEQCYEYRLAPRPLAKLLALQMVVIALVGAVTGAIT